MAAQQKPESTAVARRDEKNASPAKPTEERSLARMKEFGALNPAAQAEVRRSQHVAGVADMVGLTEWGSRLPRAGQVAMAKWCIARDVDPLTELDNVGGPYINADHDIRKLGELQVRGVVRDWTLEHIAADERLEKLAKDQNAPEDVREMAKAAHYRRLQLRIEHGVPEAATGACVCSINLASGGEPIRGCKWGGGGTSVKQPKREGAAQPNPIVENNPVLSVESQSIRRAMRALRAAHPELAPNAEASDAELKEIRAELRESSAAPFDEARPALAAGPADGAYGIDEDPPAELLRAEQDRAAEQGDAPAVSQPAPKECPGCGRLYTRPSQHHPDCRHYADD